MGRRGGGVAIYVKNDVQAALCSPSGDDENFELLWVHISLSDYSAVIGAIYHPPKPIYCTSKLLDYIEHSVETLSNSYPNSLIILAGDMNSLEPVSITERTGLADIVQGPTRGHNYLDHILVSMISCYSQIKIVKPVGKSDHKAIVAYNGQPMINRNKNRIVCNFRRRSPAANATYMNYLTTLDEQFFDVKCVTPQAAFDAFYAAVLSLLEHFYPERSITITSSDPDFITPEIKATLRRKNKLMNQGRVEEANALASKIGSIITRHNAGKLRQLDASHGAQALWDKVREVTGKTAKVATPAGITATSLNIHYASISTDVAYVVPACKALEHSAHSNISEYQIFCILDRLKPTATGLDNLPAWFLRLSAPVLARPLAQLFRLSITTGYVPTQWKQSFILPLPKVSQPLTHSDYRPISITPVLSRALERIIIASYIYPSFLDPPPTLSFIDQFAFRPTGSTTSALIYILHAVSAMLVTQPFVHVIALDFSKAFDSVRHSSLLSKLSELSVPDNIYNWFSNFLTDRSHCTKFDSQQSDFAALSASVVQGSAVGPAAYAVLASDLHPITPGNIMAKFADDTYLIVPANLSHTIDAELMHIDQWSQDNNLKLNRTKSREIIFYSHRKHKSIVTPPTLDILRVESLKCLGVTLSSNFNFSDHIAEVIGSVAQSLYALRTLRAHGLSDPLLCSVFASTALAKLRYCSPVWWGFTTSAERDRLEAVLRKAKRANFYPCDSPNFSMLCDSADIKLFRQITQDRNHTLHHLLISKPEHNHNLRQRHHNFALPRKMHSLDDCNFIPRMLYRDCY